MSPVVKKLLNYIVRLILSDSLPGGGNFCTPGRAFANLNGKAGYAAPIRALAVLGAALICQGCDRMLGHYRFCRRPKLMHQALNGCC
jgi:hypothetical protein